MKPVLSLLAAGLIAGSAFASNINVTAKAVSNGQSIVDVAPGASVAFRIEAQLTDTVNDGLALLGFDLDFTGGDLLADTITEPSGTPTCANPMPNFVKNLGITNPAGYKGTLIAGNLIQVGGGQNTIKNTADNADFPVGTVIANIAQGGASGCPANGPAIVATGTLTAPMAEGSYTLQIQNVFANVIRDGETGAVFFATEAAGVGTVTSLTINVENLCTNTSVLSTTAPADQGSLWRSERNIIRINFAAPLSQLPPPGSILIQEMLANGQYGADLSSGFTFALENGNATLRIRETATTGGPLEHRKWYAVRNVACDEIADFTRQFVVQVGDADANRFVTAVDVGQINGSPTGAVADNSRFDIDGNGFRTAVDVGIANASQGALPAKPTGH